MPGSILQLPSDLESRVVEEALRRGVTPEEVLREALEVHLHRRGDQHFVDPLLQDEAVFPGESPADLARNHDKYLDEAAS